MHYVISTCVCFAVLASPALSADPKEDAKVPEELARALKQIADSDNYGFQTSLQGRKENGVEGKYQKDQPVYFKAEQVEFFKKGDKLIYKQGEQWQRTKTGVESDPLRILAPSAKVRETVLPHEELNGVEKHLAVMELSGAKTRQVSAAAVATLVLVQEALPASADPQQAAGCPVLAHDLSDAALYLPGFVGDCCGDECAESWMMVRLFLHLHLHHRVCVRKQVERPRCHPLYIPYRRHPLGYREHLEFRAH